MKEPKITVSKGGRFISTYDIILGLIVILIWLYSILMPIPTKTSKI